MQTLHCSVLAACCAASLWAQQPPLIDREIFFDDPEISGAQISPDGKYIAFLKPLNKTRNIWVKKAEEPFSAARPITEETKRPVPAYFWSRDGKYILWVQDLGGDENFNLYAVNPADAPAEGARVPKARNLTSLEKVRVMIYSVPKSDPDSLFIGINDRDKAWHDLYKVKLSTGERTLLRKNTDRIVGWSFDLKDQLRLGIRANPNGDTEILRVEGEKLVPIYSCNVFETCYTTRFHKDNKRVWMITNKGEDLNFTSLALLDPATGKAEIVENDPNKRVDIGGTLISDVTDELVATIYTDEKTRILWKDKSFEADYNLLKKQVGGRDVRMESRTKDERLWMVSAYSDTDPGEVFLFDRKTKKLTPQYKIREKLAREHLAAMQPVRYESTGGLEIPAYLTLPKGAAPKNLPVIIVPHGGPWGRDTWGYNGLVQFLANRGYAVLQPNFRGSAGFGKKFIDLGNGQWGHTMQDDITWGVKYLIQKGIADPKRVGIMGGSYGGYATLAGVAFTPDLYAAGVSIVGPSNLITLLDSLPAYWESGRKQLYSRMADPGTPEGKERLIKMSPLHSADKIKTPLMVVQGANDPRVNKAESDQIVVALRDRGFPVEYLVAPDEGHGFARPVNSMAMWTAAEKFLAKHLGGRYQESATPEVAARLKEITVDPKTVTLAKKVDSGAVTMPQVAAGLNPGSYKYVAKLSMGTNTMNLSSTTNIAKEGENWKIIDTINTPQGEMAEEAVLDGKTLAIKRRTMAKGPLTYDFEVKGTKMVGSVKFQGNDKAVDTELGGPLFADSAGAGQVIAALPLADGYTATYRNFDIQKQKPKLMQLKVSGSESVTVPAGTFDSWKVDITSADGGSDKITMWIAKDSRKPVKSSAVLGQMGGATMTAELQ